MNRAITPKSGMSLLEVTFAAGIMATALSLLFGSLISISLLGSLNDDKALANTELSSILEELRTLEVAELLAFAPDPPDKPGNQRVLNLEYFTADGTAVALPLTVGIDGQVTVPVDLPNPLEIKATLLWNNDQGHVFQASTTTSVGR